MATLQSKYQTYLSAYRDIHKIPYIETTDDLATLIKLEAKSDLVQGTHDPIYTNPTLERLRAMNIRMSKKTKEITIQSYQRARTIAKAGRLLGNIEYLEDCWNVQIQPLSFQYAYLYNGVVVLSDATQSKIRDKYLKIKVRYDGEQYAIINAIQTFYTISHA